MEWTKKASFQDYLNDQMSEEKIFFSSHNNPSFVFQIENLPRIKPQRNPYPVRKISLVKRKELYLKKWPDKARNTWDVIEKLGEAYRVEGLLPWLWKESFRKLALRVHPDQNSSQKAKEDFQKLFQAYNELKKLV